MPDSTRVVAIGAGPVGFCAALRLAQQGIPVILIEKSQELQSDLRASTFHPPTLEMLDELELTSDLLSRGLRTDSWQIRLHETHEKAEFDLSVLKDDTRYPFRLQAEQSVLCELAAERVRNNALIDLRMATELIEVRQDDAKVTAITRSADGTEDLIEADFMIAADGSHSTVRDQLKLTFEGLTYPETTILVTTEFPFEQHLPGLSNVNYVWHNHGTFSLLRLPDIWRCSLYADPEESIEEATRPENLDRKLQQIVARPERYVIRDCRPYRIHQRIVSDYRVGRILLAGDAAHINSPSGGMGMNGGIHDAFNLTEKLAAVIHNHAPPESLDLYTRQRLPVAKQEILGQAHKNRTRMQQMDPDWRRAELTRLQNIASNQDSLRDFLLRSSMIAGLREAATIA